MSIATFLQAPTGPATRTTAAAKAGQPLAAAPRPASAWPRLTRRELAFLVASVLLPYVVATLMLLAAQP